MTRKQRFQASMPKAQTTGPKTPVIDNKTQRTSMPTTVKPPQYQQKSASAPDDLKSIHSQAAADKPKSDNSRKNTWSLAILCVLVCVIVGVLLQVGYGAITRPQTSSNLNWTVAASIRHIGILIAGMATMAAFSWIKSNIGKHRPD